MVGAVATHPELDRGQSDGITPFVPDWIVPLQAEGTSRPVFVFPSAHTERVALAIEARVAGHVGRDHPFWGFGRDESHLDRARVEGAPALAAEYVTQMRAIQGKGPFLLYGICLGGYLAWETARQLLAAGEEIAGILFYEVPLRSDYAKVLPGPLPVHSMFMWRLSHYFQMHALPIHLTHLMTAGWHVSGWWRPWQEVALGGVETVVIPGETKTAFVDREERIARHVRDWIERAEVRIRV
jgi:hypothetical protein